MMNKKSKTASFFDIDGTLMSGLVLVSFHKFLLKKGLVDIKTFEEANLLLEQYQKRKINYRKLGELFPEKYAQGIKEKTVKQLNEACSDFFKTQKINIYPFSKDLITYMKQFGPTIAITGSPIEPITELNRVFGFDKIYATQAQVKNGKYTGKLEKNMVLKETKEKTIQKILQKNGFNPQTCFGFGDTEQDLAIFENVGTPIALNPSNELLKICHTKNWPFFYKDADVFSEVKKIVKQKPDKNQ